MSEENKNESHRAISMVMVVAIAVPLLYVLGTGPAEAVCKKFPKTQPALRAFYFPLIWLHDHTALQKPLDFYIRLW
jgi:hypothetical protein